MQKRFNESPRYFVHDSSDGLLLHRWARDCIAAPLYNLYLDLQSPLYFEHFSVALIHKNCPPPRNQMLGANRRGICLACARRQKGVIESRTAELSGAFINTCGPSGACESSSPLLVQQDLHLVKQ